MGDLLTAAKLLGQVAIAMAALAGDAAHRTAIANAREALAEAHRRAQERREVDAVIADIARRSGSPFTADDQPARTAVR